MNIHSNLRRRLVVVAASATGVAAVAGLMTPGASRPVVQHPAAHDHVRVSTLEASYPVYRGLRALTADSAAVVRGTVTQVLPARRIVPAGGSTAKLPAFKRENLGFLVTDHVVRVDKVVEGPAGLTGKRIVVTQLGGQQGHDRFVAEDQPLSENGQDQLLFLRPDATGRFVIVGGSQGRYLIRNGKLNAVSDEATSPVAQELRGMRVATVVRDFGRLEKSHAPAARHASEQPDPPATTPRGLDKPLGSGAHGAPPVPPARVPAAG